MKAQRRIAATCLIVGGTTFAFAADPSAPAVINVSDTVIASDVKPLGVNLTKITGGTNFASNNFIAGSGFEPAAVRYLVRVERSGPDWFEWDSNGGVHMWDQNATGFGNGATVRFYRVVDAGGQPLAWAGGLQDETGADRMELLGTATVPLPSAAHLEGGWVAEGSAGAVNRVWIDRSDLGLAIGDYAFIEIERRRLTAADVHPRLLQWFVPNVNIVGVPDTWDADLVDHPTPIPPAFTDAGETCLRINANDTQTSWLGQYIFHAWDEGEGQWYSQLEPGASYRAEAWLRQSGLGNGGRVRFVSAGGYASISQPVGWSVTGDWAHYTWDFTGPAYPTSDPWHQPFGLEITGPGTVWIDDFVVYRNDAAHGFAPNGPHHLSLDELLAAMPATGQKGAVRFYPVLYPGHSTLEHLLGPWPSSTLDFIYNVQAGGQRLTLPQVMAWALATGADPNSRVVPIVTLTEEYTEIEWQAVVEYLGVPYDPAVNTPAERPWAYRRFLERGHGAPWTDDFREIVLEVGNETWHNGAGGYGWHGFGRPGWVFDGGVEYGLFARMVFADIVESQPEWTQYDLGAKLKLALNADYSGGPDAYGESAARRAAAVTDYLGHANYVGPTWETGDVPFEVFDDHGMQETLVGMHTGMKSLIETAAATRDALASSEGTHYRIFAYEGGPSGYYVPGNGTPTQVAVSELFGKSAGMAVAALDAWLFSSLHGYGHQCFLGYASGQYWTTHTMPREGGFRRHSGWLALQLRNVFAHGDRMLDTTLSSVPTYQREGEDVPLVTAYTLADDRYLSVFVLSRKLDGNHDGVDFGDGVTPATLHLPAMTCERVIRYALTAPDGSPVDPRLNNTDSEQIAITSVELDPATSCGPTLVIDQTTGGVTGGLPPGSILLYVFDRGAAALFNDDFETGGTGQWTAVVP